MKKFQFFTILFFLLTGFVFFNCKKEVLIPVHENASKSGKSYDHVFHLWTKNQAIYHDFETVLFANATYHSSDFRIAFANAYENIFGSGSEYLKEVLLYLQGDSEDYHEFFMGIITGKLEWNELETEDSIWQLRLIGKEQKFLLPISIKHIRINENLKVVYPYLNSFTRAYLVRFKKNFPDGTPVFTKYSDGFALEIVSSLGIAKLEWKFSHKL